MEKELQQNKKETLEEAAEKYANKKGDIPTTKLEDAIFKQGFIDGAKWQQERMYSKGNMFTESQVLEYGEQCFEAGFAKCDIVEAGLEPKQTDIEINWILIKLMRKWQT